MRTRVILMSVALLGLVGCRSRMESHPGSITYPHITAQILSETAQRTATPEEFGKSVTMRILRNAAKQIRAGKQNPVNVDLNFTVTIIEYPSPIPRPEPVPWEPTDPNSINICWEICDNGPPHDFWNCYAGCNLGGFQPIPLLLKRSCDEIMKDLINCPDSDMKCRVKYLLELLDQGCMVWEIKPLRID